MGYRGFLRSTLIVTTKTDQSFKGVLWRSSGPLLVLKNAEKWEGNTPIPMDGEVLIHKANIDYVQKVA